MATGVVAEILENFRVARYAKGSGLFMLPFAWLLAIRLVSLR